MHQSTLDPSVREVAADIGRQRLSRTLCAEVFLELAKLTALSASVVVTVIALAAVIKPLSDGVLQAGDVLKFVLLAIPPMLAYALPFAAGFASTLVYQRLASENEATAAYAAGISHRSLLLPVIIMGVFLMCGLAVLNEVVIPRFLREGQRLITMDLPRLITQEVQRGRAVEVPHRNLLLYADRAERIEPDAASGALEQVVFTNFAVVRLDATGMPIQELTSSRATMWVYPAGAVPSAAGEEAAGPESLVVLELERVVAADDKALAEAEGTRQLVFRVPYAFQDNPKFLTYRELAQLRELPENMNWIDARRRALAQELGRRRVVEAIGNALGRDGSITLLDSSDQGVTIAGAGVDEADAQGHVNVRPAKDGFVRVRTVRTGSRGPVQVETIAREAVLRSPGGADGKAALWLELRGAQRRDIALTNDFTDAPVRDSVPAIAVRLEPSPLNDLLNINALGLIAESRDAALRAASTDPLRRSFDSLDTGVAQLHRDVTAKQHERWAFAVSCFIMTLTGAVMALRFAQRLPLTVYLWTFFPAIICLVTISGGQQTARSATLPGLALMWSGVVGLALYTLLTYRRLTRN